MLHGKRVLLIVAGGIAAFKSLELIRRLRERGASVRAVLSEAGAKFVTPPATISRTRLPCNMAARLSQRSIGETAYSGPCRHPTPAPLIELE